MVDHRPDQTPIRNQGNRDTCVGFAVSAAHEWMASADGSLSPEDAMWAGHSQGGRAGVEATSIHRALSGLAVHRHAREEAWPYGTPPWPASRPVTAADPAQQRDLPLWRELIPPDYSAVAGALDAELAVLLSLRVVYEAWHREGGQIDADSSEVWREGHAVLAVGVVDGDPTEPIIIKNSWGLNWGDAGYGFLTKRYFENFIKRAFVLERP